MPAMPAATPAPRITARTRLTAVLLGTILAPTALLADELHPRHGCCWDPMPPGLEAGTVATFQTSSDGRADQEFAASLDILYTTRIGDGELQIYAEGSTTPRTVGVGALLPDANGDLGSALDGNGEGRLQISELHYTWRGERTAYTVGLLNTTAFLDASRVANDETAQFLAAPLVNNPTVQFPDYTLGGALRWQPNGKGPNLYLLASSSHGLGDNPDASYGELFDLGDTGKGVFVAAEAEWQGAISYRLGIWSHTAANPPLDGAGSAANYGLYGVVDGAWRRLRWTARAGVANPRVSETAWFVSAAAERDIGPVTAGLGTALSGASSELGGGSGDGWVNELYLSHDITGSIRVSPHLQYHHNPGLDRSGMTVDASVWTAGVRLNVMF